MSKCDYCGTTILFGGQKTGTLRYCNARCASSGTLVQTSMQLPGPLVQQQTLAVHKGSCPKCKGSGPVDVHTSYRVWSFVLFTRWSSHPQVCCRACGARAQLGGALLSVLAGWWGIPWGLIMTPIQIGKNIIGMVSPPDSTKPSPQLERLVRLNLGSQLAQQSPRSQV